MTDAAASPLRVGLIGLGRPGLARCAFADHGLAKPLLRAGLPDRFMTDYGSQENIFERAGLHREWRDRRALAAPPRCEQLVERGAASGRGGVERAQVGEQARVRRVRRQALPRAVAERESKAGRLVIKPTTEARPAATLYAAWRNSRTHRPGKALKWWVAQVGTTGWFDRAMGVLV